MKNQKKLLLASGEHLKSVNEEQLSYIESFLKHKNEVENNTIKDALSPISTGSPNYSRTDFEDPMKNIQQSVSSILIDCI